MGLISGLERSPGGRNSNPLQYSCLKNPVDWQAAVRGVARSQTQLNVHTRPRHFQIPEEDYILKIVIQRPLCLPAPPLRFSAPVSSISLNSSQVKPSSSKSRINKLSKAALQSSVDHDQVSINHLQSLDMQSCSRGF